MKLSLVYLFWEYAKNTSSSISSSSYIKHNISEKQQTTEVTTWSIFPAIFLLQREEVGFPVH